MKKTKKISFLMAVHNEEKILNKSLKYLSEFPYSNYEVVIGLDGCTDKSEKIVKEYKKKKPKIFRYFILNERKGKPAVINRIIKKASGEIIIINDADWIFKTDSGESVEKLISVFDCPKIGGIAESFPFEWEKEKIRKGNLGYKMVAYSTFFWLDFQKKNLTYKKGGFRYLKEPTMFLTNIFRKKLYKENLSLGDDFERTYDIIEKGYDVAMLDEINMPRMIVTYDKIPVKDLFRQKIRTAAAREQIKKRKNKNIGILNYYFPAVWHIFINSWRTKIKIGLISSLWILLALSGTLISRFKKINTKKGWEIRIKR